MIKKKIKKKDNVIDFPTKSSSLEKASDGKLSALLYHTEPEKNTFLIPLPDALLKIVL